MPTTPAVFDNFQLEATDYRLLLTQSEQLAARGVPDPLAPVIRRLDMNTEGDGFDPEQRFSEKMADGLDAPLSVALVGDEGTFGGNITARYRELRHDMPDLCGVDNLVSKTTLPDGRIKEVWRFPEGPRKIRTQSAWFGLKTRCWLLQYGKLQTWVLESERTGETAGNKSYHFNAAIRNQQFPAFVAQNQKYTIVGAGVTGSLDVSYLLPGSSTFRTVTMVIGDTALQTKGKFEGFGDGVTVNIVGTLSSSSTNEVQTVALSSSYTGGPIALTGSSGTASITPGMTLSAIGTALSTAYGAAGSVTATGTSVAAVVTATANGFVVAGCTGTMAVFNGNYGWDGVALTNGAKSYRKVGGTKNERVEYSGGPDWVMSNDDFIAAFHVTGDATGWSSAWTVLNTGVTPVPTTTGSGSTVNLSLTFGGTLVGTDVAQVTTTTTGVSTATTLAGASSSGGVVTVEFTSPANTRVQLSKTAGHANYSVTETQLGADGLGPIEIGGPELQPTHWLVYKGATKAELDAIDMGSATTPRDTTTSKLVRTAHGQTISFENLSQGVYLEDGKVNPGSHVTRRPTVTSSLTVDVQQAGSVDYAEDIYATENFGGAGVNPFWLRYSARCVQDELWIDGKWARNQTAAHPVAEGLAQWQFPLTRIRDKVGSLYFTFIYPPS